MKDQSPIHAEIYPLTLERVGGPELQNRFEAAVTTVAEEVQALSKRGAFTNIAVLPAFMLICYLGMWLYYRARGGYKPLSLDGH